MKTLLAFTAGILLATATAVSADHHEGMSTLNADVIWHLNEAQGKIMRLAEAMPDKKLSWRPGKEVRSAGEVYMHIAGANYFFASLLGTPIPTGIDPMTMDKSVPEKAKMIDTMKQSFAHVEKAIQGVSEDMYGEMVKTPMGDMSKRQVVLLVLRHADEHLGQSIAYARMNNVVPPWTAEENAAMKAAAEKEGK